MRRIRVPERMDDPDLPEAEHRRALRGLARLNRASGGARAIWRAARPALPRAQAPIRAIDVACGGGDVTVDLARRARRAGHEVHWTLADVSEVALDRARERFDAAGFTCETVRADALAGELPSGFDLVTCSLFIHHLDPRDVAALLRSLASAATGRVVASDLRRTRLNLIAAILASRLLSGSRVVHFDAPASVRAAYTLDELERLAESAGLERFRIRRAWPQRMILTCDSSKPNPNEA